MNETRLEREGPDRGSPDRERLRELRARSEHENAALRSDLAHAQRVALAGRLALGIVHDVNSALACVLGFNELATDADAEEAARCRKEIERAARRASALAQQMLALGRRSGPEPRVVAVDDLIDELRGTLERVFGDGERLELRLESGARVRIDPVHLTQIVLNLATNAHDALGGKGSCAIATRTVGAAVELTVTDDGTGIAERDVGRVFDPFFTTKPADRGTGLGLALVAELTRSVGGEVEVESEAGRGATFRVRLPIATP